MKKMLKVLSKRAAAAAVSAAVMFTFYAPTVAQAAEKQYVSDVYISYGADDESAKKWLTDNGYTVVDQNLNEGAESAQWMSWAGLASEKRSVYLGYKTTTDPEEAITDMRVMHMNGEFSYEDFKKILEDQKQELNRFAENIKIALAEYRENYKNGVEKAKIAHDNLNLYTDDDSADTPMGDLLLQPIREEMSEEDYEKEPEKHADMTTILMQGNSQVVKGIMETLVYACDTSDTTWLERLKKLKDSEGLYEKYEKKYPDLSETTLEKLIAADHDESAKYLADSFENVKPLIELYKNSGLTSDSSEEDGEKYFTENPDVSRESWVAAATVAETLDSIEYEGVKLTDFIMSDDYDFSSAEDREYLYPIVDSLSDGQRALISYAPFEQLTATAALDEDGWKTAAETAANTISTSAVRSVYVCVDRSMFSPDGIAVTNEARNTQSSTGMSFDDGLLGVGLDWKPAAGLGAAALFISAGAGLWSHGNTYAQKLVTQANYKLDSLSNQITEQEKYLTTRANEFFKKVTDADLEDYVLEYAGNQEKYVIKRTIDSWDELSSTGKIKIYKYFDSNNDGDFTLKFVKNMDDNREFNRLVDHEQYGIGDTVVAKESVGRNFYQYAGKALTLLGILAAGASAYYTVTEIYDYYHQDLAPIPRKMVNESSDEAGRTKYTYYNAALCNRDDQGFGNDALGSYGDLNGDVGKQWLALYTTTDTAAGTPILADVIAQKGDNKLPIGKTGLRLFGKTDAVNFVDEAFGYNDTIGGLYIFYATDDDNVTAAAAEETAAEKTAADSAAETESAAETAAPEAAKLEATSAEATGSAFSGGLLAIVGAISAAAGAGIAYIFTRKRKDA